MASTLSHGPFIIIRLFCKPWFFFKNSPIFMVPTFYRFFNPYQAKMTNSVVKTWLRYQLAVKNFLKIDNIWKILKFRQAADCIPKIRQDIITRIKTWFEVFKGRQVTWQILPQNALILEYQVNLRRKCRLKLYEEFWKFLKILDKNQNRKWAYFENYLISCNGIWNWPPLTCKQID